MKTISERRQLIYSAIAEGSGWAYDAILALHERYSSFDFALAVIETCQAYNLGSDYLAAERKLSDDVYAFTKGRYLISDNGRLIRQGNLGDELPYAEVLVPMEECRKGTEATGPQVEEFLND